VREGRAGSLKSFSNAIWIVLKPLPCQAPTWPVFVVFPVSAGVLVCSMPDLFGRILFGSAIF